MRQVWLVSVWGILLAISAGGAVAAAPHAKAACEHVTVIVLVGGNCHGEPGEDGCHGVVIIVASDDNCHGADATDHETAGQGCEDAIVVNVGGNDNCQGGDA